MHIDARRAFDIGSRRTPAVVFVVLWAFLAIAADPTLAGADEAFEAEDYPRALGLYEEVLARQPEDLHALFRAALLLSWDNRLEESLARYDRLLAVEPGHRDAAFERAKVLSWDGRTDAAAEAYRVLLDDHPTDVEIRLAFARCLGWAGDYRAARAEYDRVLEIQPERIDAFVGKAQTFAWAGQLKTATTWYATALEADPENKDAAIGLASVELWSGNPGPAGLRAEELAKKFPDDLDVIALQRRTRKALAPWARSFAERTEDTDGNRLDTVGLSAGLGTRRGPSMSVGVTRFEMSDRTRSASIDSLFATLGLNPAQGQRLIFLGGVDHRRNSSGETDSDVVGSAHYTWGLDRRWQLGAIVGRDALRYSPAITDNRILLDEYSAYFAARAGSRWRLNGSIGNADVSDGNRRRHLWSGFSYRWPFKALKLDSGFRFRYMDFEQDLNNAYFDPSDFHAYLVQLRGGGKYSGNENTYGFSVDAGLQSFTLNGNKIDDDLVVLLAGTLGFPLGEAFVLELTANWGDYAAQTATGFESHQFGLRLRWRGGR